MKKLITTILLFGFASTAFAQVAGGVFNGLFNVSGNVITPNNSAWVYGGTVLGVSGDDVNWAFFNKSGIQLSTTTNQVLIGAAATTSLANLEVAFQTAAKGSLLVTGSSTLQNFTALQSTSTNATSTNLFSTTASSTNLFTSTFKIGGLAVSPIVSTTTASLGGGLLTAGSCASVTATTTSTISTSMAVAVTPVTYPGDGTNWDAYIGPNNTVIVKVCGLITVTPTATTYNIRVIP